MSDKVKSENLSMLEECQLPGDKDVDQVTRVIGAVGRWHIYMTVILSLAWVPVAWHFLAITFFAPNADHWCKSPQLFNNWTNQEWKKYSIPPDEKIPNKFSKCSMYERNYSSLSLEEADNGSLPIISCQYGMEYDRTEFKHSLENEFDLVCSREYLAKTSQAVYNVGVLIGVFSTGQISDLIGRKKTMIGCGVVLLIFGISTSFVPSFGVFLFTRFFAAIGTTGLGTVSYVMMMEFIDGKWRVIMSIVSGFTWVFGYISLTGFAYLIRDWRDLQLAISVPVVLCFLYYWFTRESIRWLLSQGRIEEAETVAMEVVRHNKKSAQVKFQIKSQDNNKEKKTVLDIILFRYPAVSKRAINLYFNWFVNAFVYFGLSLGSGTIGGNVFINSFIFGVVEIPALLISINIYKWGRRWPHCLSMVIGGIACIATAAFQKNVYPHDWPIVTLAMIGKLGISVSFNILYIFTVEIYPTVVRNVGLGSSSMCARVGSIIAPYVDLLRHFHPAIPLVTFGSFSVVAGGLVLLLPETNNKSLPETLEEAENFGK